MQWLAHLLGTQEIRGSSPGRGMTDFCTSIFICLYIYIIREIKMYFYLAKVGFEPTPTSTAVPSNTETTVIPSRPLRSLKRSYHGEGLCSISLHYPSDRVTFRCANTIIYIQGIPGSYGNNLLY